MSASYFDGRADDGMDLDEMVMESLQPDGTDNAYRRSSVAGAVVPPAFVFNSPSASPGTEWSPSAVRDPSSSPTSTRQQRVWSQTGASASPLFPVDYSPAPAPLPSRSPSGTMTSDAYGSRHHRSATAPTFSLASLSAGLASTPSLEGMCPSPLDMSPVSSRFTSPMSSPALTASGTWGGPSPHRIASAPSLAPQRSARAIKSQRQASTTSPRRARSKPNLGNAPSHSQFVRATSVYPQQGSPGESVVIGMTVTPHPTGAIRSFRVAFGRTYADTRVTHQERQPSGLEEVDLTVLVPDSFTALNSGSMALVVEAADSARNLVDWSPAGTFHVIPIDPSPSPSIASSASFGGSLLSGSGKRAKNSHSDRRLPSSRSMPVLPTPGQMDLRGSVTPASLISDGDAGLDPSALAMTWAPPPPMTHPLGAMHASLSSDHIAPSTPVLDATASSSGPSSALPTPSTPGGSSKVKGIASVTAASTLLRHPPIEARGAEQPYLIRTTLLPGTIKAQSTEVAAQFRGDLNTMAVGWSQDEWANRRRLVRFWRSQTAHVIECTFAACELADFSEADAITISCIYREETDECYVTSVDVIYLLEGLMAIMFTVEEKNRIRRNLEGFRPETVSKNKLETERFFKTIMNFGPPRPRNIEKDVKVFPWRGLVPMLTKIIGKYSATPNAGPSPTMDATIAVAPPPPPPQPSFEPLGGSESMRAVPSNGPTDTRTEFDIFASGDGLGIAPDDTWSNTRRPSHLRTQSDTAAQAMMASGSGSSVPRVMPAYPVYPSHLQMGSLTMSDDALATAYPPTATPSRYRTPAWAEGFGTPQPQPAPPPVPPHAGAMTQPLPSASFWSPPPPSAPLDQSFGYALGSGGPCYHPQEALVRPSY